MAAHHDCPGCTRGEHEKHDPQHGVIPGLIGGTVCVCPGDCAARLEGERQAFPDVWRTPAAPALGTAGEADPPDDADEPEAPCAHTWTFANTPGIKICQLCSLCERIQSPDRGRAYTTALYDQEPRC